MCGRAAWGEPASDRKQLALDLLKTWQEAQNDQNFAAYQALYAPVFEGIKRAGPRVTHYDRKGWMQDRAHMFKTEMDVGVNDVIVRLGARSARLVFEQRWSNPRFTDVGRKELLLVWDGARFHIRREEQLSSLTRGSRLHDPDQFAVVVGHYIVLANADEPADASRFKRDAPPSKPAGRGTDVAFFSAPAGAKQLPEKLARYRGAKMQLLGSQGPTCQVTISELRIMRRISSNERDYQNAVSDAMDVSETVLAGAFQPQAACAGSTWARSAALPVPTVSPARPPDQATRSLVLAELSKLPAFRAIESDYRVWKKDGGRSFPDEPPGKNLDAKVVIATIPVAGGRTLVTAQLGISLGESCGESFDRSLWLVWERSEPGPSGALVLKSPALEGITLDARAAVDVDGDGKPEILFSGYSNQLFHSMSGQPAVMEWGLLRAVDGQFGDFDGLELSSYVCPC
jgi:hypothetical protein